jgi:hypothetical protein
VFAGSSFVAVHMGWNAGNIFRSGGRIQTGQGRSEPDFDDGPVLAQIFLLRRRGSKRRPDPEPAGLASSTAYKWNDDWNLISVVDLPFAGWKYGAQNYSGVGNLETAMYFSPRKNNKSLLWGAGPIIQFPTASNKAFDNGQYAAGPTFALVRQYGHWVNFIAGYQLWKIGGRSDGPAMNTSFLQLAVNYNLDKGWAIGFGTGLVSDWTIAQGEQSLVPVGLTFGRTVITRRGRPITWNVGASYNVMRPVGAPQMQYSFKLSFLFPQRTVASPTPSEKKVKQNENLR